MKKILATVLSVFLMISIYPVGLFTIRTSAETSGYYTYSISDGCARITDVDNLISGDVTIPSTLGGYSVTWVGIWAFFGYTGLTCVTLGNSDTSIGSSAFSYCIGLKDVYYSGSQAQWKKVTIEEDNDPLLNATIHYNSTGSKKYAITYKLNGGTNVSGNPTNYTVATSTITLKNPTRKGYAFKGWYSDAKFKTKVTKITKGTTGDKTLYAKWEKATYKITYKLNSGKNNSKNPKTYTVTSSTITLKNPTRKGYTFKGWYGDSKFKTKVTKITKGSTGNKTLYAKWKKK